MDDDNDNDEYFFVDEDYLDPEPRSRQVRAQIAGVSVERESGFWLILQVPTGEDSFFWPLQVTSDPLDRVAATSGQALTMLQLLSNVDMAGAIFPPHILAQLVICTVEQEQVENPVPADDSWQFALREAVQKRIRSLVHSFRRPTEKYMDADDDDDYSYTEASAWLRSRVRLPLCTLDQVHIGMAADKKNNDTVLDLQVVVGAQDKERHSWTLENLSETVAALVLQDGYSPVVSRQFLALALALRYKAPIVVSLPQSDIGYPNEAALKQAFPLYTTVSNLQQSSNRVVQNIERSFELHQLQAAWKVARQKQDFAAMAKIQAKLDELDNDTSGQRLSQLPVQPESDMDSMQ